MKYIIIRNLKLIIRDKVTIFFTFMSPIILLFLYFAFFRGSIEGQGTQISDYSVFSAVIILVVFSAALGGVGRYVDDKIEEVNKDFVVTPISRIKLTIGILASATVISSVVGMIFVLIIQIGFLMLGYSVLPLLTILKSMGIVIISGAICSALLFFPITFINSSGGYSGFASVASMLFAFLSGLYIPLGTMKGIAYNISILNPLTHLVRFLKYIVIEGAGLINAFIPENVKADIFHLLGITLKIGDHNITMMESVIYLSVFTIILTILCTLRIRNIKK